MHCDLECALSFISPNANEKVQMYKEEGAASLCQYEWAGLWAKTNYSTI